MPFEFQELTSDNGVPYLRMEASGRIELADAKVFEAHLLRPSVRGGRVLSFAHHGTEYSVEARKFFPTLRDKFSKMGVVVTSPIGRAAINVMLRLTYSGEGGIIRMFASKQEAMAWLEITTPGRTE
jgi:hypothetical protein